MTYAASIPDTERKVMVSGGWLHDRRERRGVHRRPAGTSAAPAYPAPWNPEARL